MTFGRTRNVCLICFKRFGIVEEHRGYQARIIALNSGLVITSTDEGGDSDAKSLYTRFLQFTKHYLKLTSTGDRFLAAAKDIQTSEENGKQAEEVQAFCQECHAIVAYVCDLYSELCAVKLHLVWKVGKLGERIQRANKAVSLKLGASLNKSLSTQLNINAVRPVDLLRRQLVLRSKTKHKEHPPKVLVSKGLFPEHWKFTYSATKERLMVLIVVFALALYTKREKPPPEAESKPGGRRGRKRKSATVAATSIKRELLDEEGKAVGNANEDYDEGPPDGCDNDNDSDWSRGAASPGSVPSIGSDADFTLPNGDVDDDDGGRPGRRWNFRRRKGRPPKEVNEDNEDKDSDYENKKVRKKIPKVNNRNKTGRINKLKDKAPIPCRKCHRTFLDTRGLSKHMFKIHRMHIGYSCPHCGLKFEKQAEMLEHKRKLHRYQQENSSFARLRLRGKRMKETKCTKCDQVFPSIAAMFAHRKASHKTIWSKHECPICLKTVVSEDRFESHLRSHEKNTLRDVQLFYCEVCGKHFYKKESLSEHMVSVHEGSYPCFLCEAKYPSSQELRSHLETHETEEKSYFCQFCFRGFTSQQYYDIHRKIAHALKNKQKFLCDKERCTEEFESIPDLNEHLAKHVEEALKTKNDENPTADNNGNDVNVTPVDTTPSIEGEGQQQLDEDGLKVFKCTKCDWGFLKKYNLTLHELVHTPHKVGGTGYDCPKCGTNVRYVDTLITHYNRVHGDKIKPYKCDECGTTFSSPIWYKTHMKLHQQRYSGEDFVCNICSAVCLDSVALSAHKRIHDKRRKGRNTGVIGMRDKDRLEHEYVDIMDPASPRPGSKPKIKKKVGRPRMKPITEEEIERRKQLAEKFSTIPCELCEEKFENAYKLRKHMESVHEMEEVVTEDGKTKPRIPCHFCFKTFIHPQTYDLHLRAVHKKKMFGCDASQCDFSFLNLEELHEHLKSHLTTDPEAVSEGETPPPPVGTEKTEKPEPCEPSAIEETDKSGEVAVSPPPKYHRINHCHVCSWGFVDKNLLDLHVLVHIPKSTEEYGHPCPRCHDTFGSTAHLVNHFNKYHGVNLRPYKCFECSKSFFTKLAINLHTQRHERRRRIDPNQRFICVDCGVECKDNYLLGIHRRKHDPANHVQCPECDKTFDEKKHLSAHLKREHGHGERYPCPVCGMMFIYAHYIRQHMVTHQEASFECDVCHKKFKRISTLNVHKLQHDPNRTSFICFECGMSYKTETGLRFHMSSIHTPESQRKHACPTCPRRFHRIMLLRMHMKTCSAGNRVFGDASSEAGNEKLKATPKTAPVRRSGRPRKKPKWQEEEEESEESSSSSEDEKEESPEKTPTSSAINAILQNLTGIPDLGDPHFSNEAPIKRPRRSTAGKRNYVPNSSTTTAADDDDDKPPVLTPLCQPTSSTLQSTIDHMLFQNLSQHHNQFLNNSSQSSSSSQQSYQSWINASAAAHPPFSSAQFIQQSQQFPNVPTTNPHRFFGQHQNSPEQIYSPNHVYSPPGEEPQNLHFANK